MLGLITDIDRFSTHDGPGIRRAFCCLFSGMSDALRLVPFSGDATCLTGAYIQIHEMHRMQKLYVRLSTWSDHTEEI